MCLLLCIVFLYTNIRVFFYVDAVTVVSLRANKSPNLKYWKERRLFKQGEVEARVGIAKYFFFQEKFLLGALLTLFEVFC